MGTMYGIVTYIYHKNKLNVGKYTIHGSYGLSIPNFYEGNRFFNLHNFVKQCLGRAQVVGAKCNLSPSLIIQIQDGDSFIEYMFA